MGKFLPILLYTEFYDKELPKDMNNIFKYNADSLVKILANISAILYFDIKDSDRDTQLNILGTIFSKVSLDKQKRLMDLFNTYTLQNATLILFCIPTTIMAIGEVIKRCDPEKHEDIENEENFQEELLDFILYLNDIYFPNTTEKYSTDSYENIWFNLLNQQNYVRDRQKANNVYPITAQFFCSFIYSRTDDGVKCIEEFCKYFGIRNFKGYILPFLHLLINSLSEFKATRKTAFIVQTTDPNYQLLNRLSLSKIHLSDPDFSVHMKLVPNPFWKCTNGEIIIIDFNLLGFINDIGLIYNFYALTSLKIDPKLPDLGEYRSYLGKEYYEDFLADKLLKSLFNRKGSQVFHSKKIYFPDFTIVQDGKNLFFIEVKSSSINAKFLEKKKVEEFKKYLDSSYASSKDVKDRNKGIYQLATSIEKFATTPLLDNLLSGIPKSKCRIYPIIIYTDNSLDVNGVNNYLNEKFTTAINPFKDKVREVFPLVTVNMTFFISNYSSLKTDKKFFRDCIREFVKKTRNLSTLYKKTGSLKTLWDSNISFHQFISKRKNTLDNYKNIENDHFSDLTY